MDLTLPAPGTRVRLDDPDFGPMFGRVVVDLCKRHTWQPSIQGRECGHADCGFPRAASACPWPVHVNWDNGNESHQHPDDFTPPEGE